MFQNLLKLIVPLSKYNVLKIKVIFWYFKQEYVICRLIDCPIKNITMPIKLLRYVSCDTRSGAR